MTAESDNRESDYERDVAVLRAELTKKCWHPPCVISFHAAISVGQIFTGEQSRAFFSAATAEMTLNAAASS